MWQNKYCAFWAYQFQYYETNGKYIKIKKEFHDGLNMSVLNGPSSKRFISLHWKKIASNNITWLFFILLKYISKLDLLMSQLGVTICCRGRGTGNFYIRPSFKKNISVDNIFIHWVNRNHGILFDTKIFYNFLRNLKRKKWDRYSVGSQKSGVIY
jgi:hypothetical protein